MLQLIHANQEKEAGCKLWVFNQVFGVWSFHASSEHLLSQPDTGKGESSSLQDSQMEAFEQITLCYLWATKIPN